MLNNGSRFLASFVSSWAFALVLAAGAGLVAPTAAAADAPKQNSPKVGKILKAAQDEIKNKKYADAIAKLKEADETSGKNAYDQHIINDMLGYCAVHTNDLALAGKAWEAEIDDGMLAPQEQQQKVRALSEIDYQLKNYDKAIEFGQRALKGGFGDEQTKKLVGQAYYLKGDWKSTLHFEEALVDPVIKSGGTPANESLQLILSSCVKLEDHACETRALEKLVTYYPKADYWNNLLFGIMKETAASDSNTLQVYRLMSEVDVLKTSDDYTEMAQLALEFGSPGEAEQTLEKGFQKNVFNDQRSKDKNQRLLAKAKQLAATDQAGLAKNAQEADSSPTGGKNVGMGIAYFGYQQYQKAADELSKGISKGGLRNPNEAQLLLGMAELKSGHKDDAVKAFHAVKGDPVLEKLAGLWVLHARQA